MLCGVGEEGGGFVFYLGFVVGVVVGGKWMFVLVVGYVENIFGFVIRGNDEVFGGVVVGCLYVGDVFVVG